MERAKLKAFLDAQVIYYNRPSFMEQDPISIPKRFSQREDIEIAGFFAALLSWGKRASIINSCNRLLLLMDEAPSDFIHNFKEPDLKPFVSFVHRTFNATDLLYTLHFLQEHYHEFGTLEPAFSQFINSESTDVEAALSGFHHYFFRLDDAPLRSRKHIASPERKSACKRLNMYLRWMVRRDGVVDFGLWQRISPAQLICPLDVHVGRVARYFGLLGRTQNDWKAALELTEQLRIFNPEDPVIYDFALFGMGINPNGRTFLR